MSEHTKAAIVKRLRSQHHDLLQGAYYSPSEDPDWDATADAADEIESLRTLIGQVVACMDADDFWQLTEMFPRLLAASSGRSEA